MKDHEIRELVNKLRAIAVTYHGTQQLREHISRTINDAIQPRFAVGIDPDMSNAACLREINEALGGMDITMFSQVATGIRDIMEGYEEAAADKRRLVRELDVLLNGENTAKQASLCDIVAQVRAEGLKLAAPAPAYPETLPCAVILEPGLRFGEGVKVSTVLNALARRERYNAELAAMTPGELAQHHADVAVIASMMCSEPPAPAPAAPADLIMQVRRLVHALKKANPDHALVKQVPDYMRRAGYWKMTDCLRGGGDE